MVENIEEQIDEICVQVAKDWRELEKLDAAYRNNKRIVLIACKQNADALLWVSDELKKEIRVVMTALDWDWQNFQADKSSERFRADRLLVLTIVSRWGCALEFAAEYLKTDREICLTAVRQEARSLQFCCEELRNDYEIVLTALKHGNGSLLSHVGETQRKNRQIVLLAIRSSGNALQFAHCSLQADEDIVLQAINFFPEALKFAAPNLRNSRHINMIALERSCFAIRYCDALRNDYTTCLALIRRHGYLFKDFSNELRANRQIVTIALQTCGNYLEFAHPDLRSDFYIVMQAVRHDGEAAKWASKALRNNRAIALAACASSGHSLKYFSENIKSDKKIVKIAVRQNGDALQYASIALRYDTQFTTDLRKEKNNTCTVSNYNISSHFISTLNKFRPPHHLQSDREIVVAAIIESQYCGSALNHVADKYKNDRDIVLAACKKNGNALGTASENLRKDKEIVMEAVKRVPHALKYALYQDEEILYQALKKDIHAFQYAHDSLKCDLHVVLHVIKLSLLAVQYLQTREAIKVSVKYDGRAFFYVPKKYQTDLEIIHISIKQYGFVIRCIPKYCITPELALLAVQADGFSIQYLPEYLRKDRKITITAVKQSWLALQYTRYKNEKLVVQLACQQDARALFHAHEQLQNDRSFILNTARRAGKLLHYCKFATNRNFILQAMRLNGLNLKYVIHFKSDREVILAAIQQDIGALAFLPVDLSTDPLILLDFIHIIYLRRGLPTT
mmetsp:Transcript_4024/g.6186  ORF Transcript_4024/g.6186 Transcript_4024/m.6186 type:complete len:737 (-) Transcript_4024:54-2264(-)